jgi:hypothetical protein
MKTVRLLRLASFILPIGLALAMSACSGCASFKEPPRRVVVLVKDADHYEVDGKLYSLADLPKAVKRTGARGDTEIMMQIPPDFPQKTLIPAYAALNKAGYKKTFFSGPREVTTQIGAPIPTPAGTKTPPSENKKKPAGYTPSTRLTPPAQKTQGGN